MRKDGEARRAVGERMAGDPQPFARSLSKCGCLRWGPSILRQAQDERGWTFTEESRPPFARAVEPQPFALSYRHGSFVYARRHHLVGSVVNTTRRVQASCEVRL